MASKLDAQRKSATQLLTVERGGLILEHIDSRSRERVAEELLDKGGIYSEPVDQRLRMRTMEIVQSFDSHDLTEHSFS